MGTSFPAQGPLSRRVLGGLLVLVLAMSAGAWLASDLAAQNPNKEEEEKGGKPKKKVTVEDEEPAKRPKAGSKDKEEEEDRPNKPRKVIKVDDEDPKPTKPRPKPTVPEPTETQTSLVEALRDTKNPELQALYGGLKVPHDRITVRHVDELRTYPIEPLTRYHPGERPSLGGPVRAWIYDEEWRRAKNYSEYASAERIQPYEEIALEDVDAFLKKDLPTLDEKDRRRMTRAEMLKAAETVLAAVDRWHASALATGTRKGDWEPVEKRLHERLFEVQRERLGLLAKDGDWDAAVAYARSLTEAYHDPRERTLIGALLVQMMEDTLRANNGADQVRQVRRQLRTFEQIFPGSDAARPIATRLQSWAQGLLNDAAALRGAGKLQEAQEKMELAADIWPSLTGLADQLAQLEKDHPVLRVGVRDLPQRMLPGQAVTDADLRAVELMFEGLVKLRVQPGVGQRYEPALAGGPPRLVPLGREFRIARGAVWADGAPVTVGDVKETLRVMREPQQWPGYSPAWNRMIDAEGGGNSFRLSMRLSQGYLDPLSLMTFKVMPQSLIQRGLPSDPKEAVGSGPFKYSKTISTLDNRSTAVFVANPHYGTREGKLGSLRLTDKSLATLRGAGVAEEVMKSLRPLKDRLFETQDEFDGELARTLDRDEFQRYRNLATDAAVKRGLPRIREIHFVSFTDETADPVALLRDGKIDMLLDLPAARAGDKELRGNGNVVVRGPMTNRRVYFLAVNHRGGALKDNPFLRKALAFAIDRQKILNDYFRDEPGGKMHHSLNGPFPAGSWACDKGVPAELFDFEKARGQVKPAVEKAGGPVKLTLKYPTGDKPTRAALEYLVSSVNNALKIDDKNSVQLELVAVEPHKLRDDVEKTHDYELAYYHYDYPSEAYWLGPLFDLTGTGINGSNFLGYVDGRLQTELEQAKSHRDFKSVQEATHLVHQMLNTEMPLVPLWQLDTYLAYRKTVKLEQAGVDPLLIFNDVERWSLEAKGVEGAR
jgi:ABC-type transport system substrate-binding protein